MELNLGVATGPRTEQTDPDLNAADLASVHHSPYPACPHVQRPRRQPRAAAIDAEAPARRTPRGLLVSRRVRPDDDIEPARRPLEAQSAHLTHIARQARAHCVQSLGQGVLTRF